MAVFDDLLEVQAHDTAIDRLMHRRQTLPERRELAAVEARLAAVAVELRDAVSRRDEVGGRLAKLEKELAASEARISSIDKRMYSGEVSASRDLQAMAAEIESLKRRVSSLEDSALAAMDEREPFELEVAALEAERVVLQERGEAARKAIDATEAVIDGEAEVERQARGTLAGALPADLVDTYERLRSHLGGIGAARLEHGSCTGCHLRISAIESDQLKRLPPDALAFCEQCGRILVRTAGGGAPGAGVPDPA